MSHRKKSSQANSKANEDPKKRGESVEFADHRPYTAGDDLRHIDWNIYARLDRFFMKLFMEEEDLSLHIVIDASASSRLRRATTSSTTCNKSPWPWATSDWSISTVSKSRLLVCVTNSLSPAAKNQSQATSVT